MDAFIEILKIMHVMDLVIAAIILGAAMVGFAKGTLKVLMVIAAVLVGFVVASIFYGAFSGLLAPFFHLDMSQRNDKVVADAVSFFLLNTIIALLVGFLLFSFLGHLEVRGRYGSCADKPIGMILGFIAGLVIAGILITLISVPYELSGKVNLPPQQGEIGSILHVWYVDSILASPIRDKIMPFVVSLLTPIMPGGAPDILTGITRT
jgi:uncharacterized membrane protein required for colicin V production